MALWKAAAGVLWHSADVEAGWYHGWIPDVKSPMGSLQYAAGVVEIGTQYNMSNGMEQGFHYLERGSLLAEILFIAGSAIGAKEEANRTGQAQEYHVDASPKSHACLGLDWTSDFKKAELFYAFPIGSEETPNVLDFGVHYINPRAHAGTIGLMTGYLYPLTQYTQFESKGYLVFGGCWWGLSQSVVGNLGDRYYARFQLDLFGSLASTLSLGVRL
jgi:hypothetical protein